MQILDGCLVTRQQRAEVFDYLGTELGYRVLFIECTCDDPRSLERNYAEIIRNSADYAGMDPALAAEDLQLRVSHYLAVYEPLDEKEYARIRMNTVNMSIEAQKISGHVESIVLGYLGSVNAKAHTLYFSRHGESENNVIGKIGGDTVLSPRGENYAQALASRINAMHIPDLRILTSRLRRTIATARGIEAAQREHLAELNELDAGVCEGLSYEEMQQLYPQVIYPKEIVKFIKYSVRFFISFCFKNLIFGENFWKEEIHLGEKMSIAKYFMIIHLTFDSFQSGNRLSIN